MTQMTTCDLHNETIIQLQRDLAAANARAVAYRINAVEMPENLSGETKDLVVRFATALAAKLRRAEQKYGFGIGWMKDDWMDECREELREHVKKGDPLDVAAYAAFLWHHGESTHTAAIAAKEKLNG